MTDATTDTSYRWLFWLLLIPAVGFTVYQCVDLYPWILDDAFISFRYAENLAAGNGPVFNAGEYVEGYTTFLWVVLLAIGKLLGANLIFFSRLLGSLFAAGTLAWLSLSYRRSQLIEMPTALIAVLFVGTCGAFAPWAISGMEVTLFTMLVTGAVLLHLRDTAAEQRNRRAAIVGLVCAIAALTRPEGLMLFGVIWLDQLLRSVKDKDKGALYMLGAFLLLYAPYFIWRFSYYGYLLPNTFYAKVGSTSAQLMRGFDYVSRFYQLVQPLLIVALLPLFWPAWWRRYSRLRVVPSLALAFVAYSILVGGDCMPAFRFLTPVIPLFALLAALNLRLIRWRWVSWVLICLITAFSIFQARSNSDAYDSVKKDLIAWRGKEVGLWLRYNVAADAVVATNTAGSVPYFSGLSAIDMLGMNDEHIAHCEMPNMGAGFVGHEKGDGAYVLSRRPDVIIFGSAEGWREPTFPSGLELYDLHKFHELYEFRSVRLPSGGYLKFYQLRAI